MRLIDADALESKKKTIYMEHENVSIPTRVISIADLHLAPTIDAEPVRHGRWTLNHAADYECSECGYENTWETAYCPNCGAKMDMGD